MLSSGAREILTGVEAVIVDEIHAVAATKRGAHLALTLERLAALQADGREPQRIGLSAPRRTRSRRSGASWSARGGRARSSTPACASRWTCRSTCRSSRWSSPSRRVGADPLDPLDPLIAGGEATRRSIWPAIYPEILRLVQAAPLDDRLRQRPPRRRAPRAAPQRARQRGPARGRDAGDIARAHHGSLAREERLVVEEMLKAGELPCLVATSSLELGIDMGAVDLVLQVESPKSVARGLQRIGRAGHNVGDTSKGRIFPKFRADLLECAVVCKLMREGEIEPTVVPRNALDVLAQQIVSIAASRPTSEPVAVDDLYALVTRTHSYAELSRAAAGERARHARRALPVAGVRRAARADRLGPRRRHDPPAQGRAPARDHQRRHDPRPRPVQRHAARRPPRRRARRGDGLRGARGPDVPARRERPGASRRSAATASSSRPRRARPARCRSGRATASGARRSSARRSARSAAGRSSRTPRRCRPTTTSTRSPRRTCSTSCASSRPRRACCRRDRTIVVERFRDEIGDWRLCVLSPVRRARARRLGPGAERAASASSTASSPTRSGPTTGSSSTCPTPTSRRARSSCWSSPTRSQDAVVAELGVERAVRRALPRERRPRAADPARLPGQAHAAVAAAPEVAVAAGGRQALPRLPDHPRDLPRVPARRARRARAWRSCCAALHARELSLVEVETPTASPFASSLLFDYVATYMYEGDAPNAERRAAALSLDRDLLRELLGQEELRELIDPRRARQVEDDLQHRSDRTRAETRDALADVLRRLGDLTVDEVRDRVLAGHRRRRRCSTRWRDERRAIVLRIGGEQRWVAADDAGLYRDALGAVPPGGLPDAFTADVPDALAHARRPLRAHPRPVHDRRAARALRRRSDRGARARWSATASSCAASCAPAATGARVVRHRGPAPPAPRVAGRAAQGDRARRPARAGGVPAVVAGRRPPPRRRAPGSTACARCSSRCRGSRCPPRCGSATCCRAASAPTRRPGWTSCARRARSSGSAPGRSGARPAGSRCTSARTPRRSAAPAGPRAHERARRARARRCCASASPRRRASSPTCSPSVDLAPEQVQEALWDLVWAGEVTNDAFAPLRAPRLTLAARAARPPAAQRGAAASARAAAARQPTVQGRWALTDTIFRREPEPGAAPPHAGRAAARALRHRHARAGARRGHPRRLLDPLRRAVAARDARRLPARLLRRGPRRRAVRAARRGRAAARAAGGRGGRAARARRDRPGPALRRRAAVAARATTRAARAGARARRLRRARRRRAGALRREGRPRDRHARRRRATRACARPSRRSPQFVTGGRGRKLSLERVDGEPVVGSPLEPLLDRARLPRRARASSR